MESKELLCSEKFPHYNKIEEVKKKEPTFDEII